LSERGRAALYRDGLLIAFLACHPIRLKNLASLRIGQHLLGQGDRYILRLDAAETKGRRPVKQYEERLSSAITRYIDHYRPVLLQARGRWQAHATNEFWISRDGSPCKPTTFQNLIKKHCHGPDGRRLSPHLFRSIFATTVAITAPQSIGLVPIVLAQASPKTSERYYNLADSLEASRAYGTMLDELHDEIEVSSLSEQDGERS
jgi:integrase